ncbi:hypothetical protein [Acidithiobacillus concretivorus]|uniref:Uncharacterized protein n=1 Tax=Acidithiobacillus concretivorus TaxID=3063952 RepID=A0ABS5ZNZ8_9PROT|nr:hypothetical protein [Acidithiobacillus concretivorus]MBU2738297.1 hypothetical protein [Acidithiobacillus concretivorus]
MKLAEAQRAFTQSMRSKYPNLFPEPENEDYAINRYGIEVYQGWFPIVEHMIDQIAAYAEHHEIDDFLRITQIKTDYCLLRCKSTLQNDELDQIINAHNEQATNICEQCEKQGEIRVERRWKTVLCDMCNSKK